MRNIHSGICVVLMTVGVSCACSPLQEPWVSDAEQLKKERYVSPEQERVLRKRVTLSQSDR